MNIRPNKIKQNLQLFHDLQIKETFATTTFDEAILFMSNKNIIKETRSFLQFLAQQSTIDIMIDTKTFLCIYMICYFHNDVLSSNKNDTEELLYKKCKELVNFIFKDDFNIDAFDINDLNIDTYIKKLNTFEILFTSWKKKDIKSQKNIYLSMYLDYTEEINTFVQKAKDINRFDYYKDYLHTLIDMKTKIKNCLIQLIGKDEFEKLEQTKLNPIGLFTKKSKELVENYLIEAYWNIFKENLDNLSIKDEKIIDNLSNTIKDYFKHIYFNNENKIEIIDNKINFIMDKIKKTNNSVDYLIDLIYLLYNEIIFLQPTHSILETVETRLETLDTVDEIIFVLKILMKEFSLFKKL